MSIHLQMYNAAPNISFSKIHISQNNLFQSKVLLEILQQNNSQLKIMIALGLYPTYLQPRTNKILTFNLHIIIYQLFPMSEDHQVDPQQQYTNKLPPANPIYTKQIRFEEPKPVFKFQFAKNEIIYKGGNNKEELSKSYDHLIELNHNKEKIYDMYSCLDQKRKIYQKFDNKKLNTVNAIQYTSGLFLSKTSILFNKKQINDVPSLLKQFDNRTDSQPPTIQYRNDEMTFHSNFQSGNLFSVFQRSMKEFDLTLQNDINSKGNTQWFNFLISNLPKDVEITFNIVNLLKTDSLFNYGMQPVVFSKLRHKLFGEGWKRQGKSISYFKNQNKRQGSKKNYYTLSFKIVSKMKGDTLQIAHCFPYTYSMVQQHISNILKHPIKKPYFSSQLITQTPTKHNINILTITQKKQVEVDDRPLILILARQHPGQSQGSYVCEGLINYLLSTNSASEFIRKNYITKIIPMINPDGVIFGNYRTNLLGVDLNRKWNSQNDELSPEVSAIKLCIQKLNKVHTIRMAIDLHGHSRKLGSFFYGNPNNHSPQQARLFPYICSKLNKQVVFNDCTFSIQTGKMTSARVFLHKQLLIKNVYTYQTSFFGYRKEGRIFPFNIQDYKRLGTNLVESLFEMLQTEVNTDKPNRYKTQLSESPQLLKVGDDDCSGSDSKPDQCELDKTQLIMIEELSEQQGCIFPKLRLQEDKLNKNQKLEQLGQQTKGQSIQNYDVSIEQQCMKSRKKTKSVLPMNKINSKAPNRYDLALQPIASLNKIKHSQRINKSLKQIKIEHHKISVCTQTCDQTLIQTLNNYQSLATNKRRNKSFSTTQTGTRKPFILKLDVPQKLSYFIPNPYVKMVSVSTQTRTSNLLGCSPLLLNKNSTEFFQKSNKISMFRGIRAPLQRMSLCEKTSDLIKKKNLQSILSKAKKGQKIQQIEKSLHVNKKHIFESKSLNKK